MKLLGLGTCLFLRDYVIYIIWRALFGISFESIVFLTTILIYVSEYSVKQFKVAYIIYVAFVYIKGIVLDSRYQCYILSKNIENMTF